MVTVELPEDTPDIALDVDSDEIVEKTLEE